MRQAQRSLVQPGRSPESALRTRAVLGRRTPASLSPQTQGAPGRPWRSAVEAARVSRRPAAGCCLRPHGQAARSLSEKGPPARLLVCRRLCELRQSPAGSVFSPLLADGTFAGISNYISLTECKAGRALGLLSATVATLFMAIVLTVGGWGYLVRSFVHLLTERLFHGRW